jgi:N6-adenosine-specific RNA methylase IME4
VQRVKVGSGEPTRRGSTARYGFEKRKQIRVARTVHWAIVATAATKGRHPMTIFTADPPWKFDDSLPGSRGSSAHLHPLTLEQIKHTELPPMDPDSVLFLWRPPSRLGDALAVCEAWGFTPKTEGAWVKTTVHGKRAFGMGHILRGEHETYIVAVRGRPEVADRSVRSTFSAPQQPFSKPDEFYDIVAKLYPGHTWYDRTARAWHGGWNLHARGKAPSVRPPAAPSASGVQRKVSSFPHARKLAK